MLKDINYNRLSKKKKNNDNINIKPVTEGGERIRSVMECGGNFK